MTMDAPADGGFSLSYEQRVTVQVRQEESFAMRIGDWARLRSRVQRLKKQRREFSAAAWTCVGLAISAGFSAVTWAPAFRVLTVMQQAEFMWVWTVIGGLGLFGVCMSVGMFWAAHVTKDAAAETVETLADDMDSIRDVRDLISA